MQVTMLFFGVFRTLAGLKELRLELGEGATLHQAVRLAGDKLAPAFSQQVLAPLETEAAGNLQNLILLNHTHLPDRAGLDQALADGDEIAWVPPMEGGSCQASEVFGNLTKFISESIETVLIKPVNSNGG